jgi:hypothetical protein
MHSVAMHPVAMHPVAMHPVVQSGAISVESRKQILLASLNYYETLTKIIHQAMEEFEKEVEKGERD